MIHPVDLVEFRAPMEGGENFASHLTSSAELRTLQGARFPIGRRGQRLEGFPLGFFASAGKQRAPTQRVKACRMSTHDVCLLFRLYSPTPKLWLPSHSSNHVAAATRFPPSLAFLPSPRKTRAFSDPSQTRSIHWFRLGPPCQSSSLVAHQNPRQHLMQGAY